MTTENSINTEKLVQDLKVVVADAEELLRATAPYWSRFSQARYVEPLEVVRDSDASASASAGPGAQVLGERVLDAG